MAKAQNTPDEAPEQEEFPEVEEPQENEAPEPDDTQPVQNIAPVEAVNDAPVTVDVDGNPFPIGYTEVSEHYSVESRLTPTGNPVVTVRRNGYVGDEYDIPAAYFEEFRELLG